MRLPPNSRWAGTAGLRRLAATIFVLLASCSGKTSATPTPAPTENASATSTSALGTPTPTAAAVVYPRAVIITCTRTPDVAPRGIQLACADNGTGLEQLAWTNWGASRATASGLRFVKDCKPNCAEGHIQKYRATAVVYDMGTVNGRRAYTRLDITTYGDYPSWIKNPDRWTLGSNGPGSPNR